MFHQAALRITHCAVGAEGGDAGDGRRHLRPARTLCERARQQGGDGVLGLDLRHGERVPDAESSIHPYANRTLYGAAKSFGEGLLRAFNDMYGLDYVALRYFNVYGPRMDIHGRYTEVMIRWMERIDAGLPPIIFGDGTQTMDFIHVSDVARANLLAAASDATDVVLTSAPAPRPASSSLLGVSPQ